MENITDIAQRLYVLEGRRDEFVRLMQEHDTITDFESEIFRKDGTTIWISENCRAIRDAEGKPWYYEDVDLLLRLRRDLALQTWYEPQSRVIAPGWRC